jgi:uncharacterized RDD family membrane protein YckC
MLILIVLMIVMMVTQNWEYGTVLRVTSVLILTLFYEPVLTVYSATVGQRVMGIRVRSANDPTKRINFLQAIIRLIAKAGLGWISFVTIHSNPKSRAIHDLVAGSVMVENAEVSSLDNRQSSKLTE